MSRYKNIRQNGENSDGCVFLMMRIVALAIGHHRGGHNLGGGGGVRFLIVKEDVRAECGEHLFFAYAAEEESLVHANIPAAQGFECALVRRRAARCNQRISAGRTHV